MTVQLVVSGIAFTLDDVDADLCTLKWYLWISNKGKPCEMYYASGRNKELLHRTILSRIIRRQMQRGIEIVDHINGDTTDNRRENLRLANHSQNRVNSKPRSDNKIGIKGVSVRATQNGVLRYSASLEYKGKHIHFGTFSTPEEAQEAQIAGAKRYYGEFARSD